MASYATLLRDRVDTAVSMYRPDLLAGLRAKTANRGARLQVLALAAKVQDSIFGSIWSDRRDLRQGHPRVRQPAQDTGSAL